MSDRVVVSAGAVLVNGEFGELPLVADFIYDTADPLAVSMTLILDVTLPCGDVAQADTTWTFARDILDSALSRLLAVPVGDGDVSATYLVDKDLVRIELTTVDDRKHPLYVEAEPIYDFLEQSMRLRPVHEDSVLDEDVLVQVEDAIAQILGGAA